MAELKNEAEKLGADQAEAVSGGIYIDAAKKLSDKCPRCGGTGRLAAVGTAGASDSFKFARSGQDLCPLCGGLGFYVF